MKEIEAPVTQWSTTVKISEARAHELVTLLERRGRAEEEMAFRTTYLKLLDIKAGERVLDIGCGSGVVTRELARRVGPDGIAVGLDQSPPFLVAARELAILVRVHNIVNKF
jgi:ubiquinone/menaquinone biosynthesis C-methylase UbiE